MICLKNTIKTMFVIGLLTLGGSFAMKNQINPMASSSVPQSDNEKYMINTEEEIDKARVNCKKSIEAVFNAEGVVNLQLKDYVETAIRKLTSLQYMNVYASLYYKSLYKFILPGSIQTVDSFCQNYPEETVDCIDKIKLTFRHTNPRGALTIAFHEINENYVLSDTNQFTIAYYYSIIQGFEVQMVDPITPANFLQPHDFCVQMAKPPIYS